MSIWTENDLKILNEFYNLKTNKELAIMLDKTENAIKCKASKMGLKRDELYCYDKNYFNDITTSNQAYWLGFIYADGYITSNKKETKYSLGIELQKSDNTHLQKFNRCINGNIPVIYRHRKSHKCENHIIKETDVCMIRLHCSKLVKDLISHGVTKNKSFTKQAPVGLPKCLLSDFIRGYFDGNGCISYSFNQKAQKKYLKVHITTGSKDFANWLSNILYDIGFYNYVICDRKTFKIFINSKYIYSFLNYIYENSKIFLDRKYKQYLNAVYDESNTSKS